MYLADASATETLGARLAAALLAAAGSDADGPRGSIYLCGPLGAGKTTLVRGLAQGLGIQGAVKSPTYTLLEPYVQGTIRLYHFDLYRLADGEELEYLGARDVFAEPAVVVVEWPERAAGWLPEPDLSISLRVAGAGREAAVQAHGARGEALAAALAPGPAANGC